MTIHITRDGRGYHVAIDDHDDDDADAQQLAACIALLDSMADEVASAEIAERMTHAIAVLCTAGSGCN